MIELWAGYFEPKLESRPGNCLNNCVSKRFVRCANTRFYRGKYGYVLIRNTHFAVGNTLGFNAVERSIKHPS